MLKKGPEKQKVGPLTLNIGEPFSTLKFKKNESILAFEYVLMKVMGGYSDIEDFNVFLNNVKVDIIDNPDFFVENISKIKDNNIFLIEILNPDSFVYYLNLFIYPVEYEGNERYGSEEIDRWYE